MDSSALRLGVACLVALSTSQTPAMASVDDTIASIEADCRPARYCDALIEFLIATGGVISPDTVSDGLDAVFESVTGRTARQFPRFLRDLIALGVTPEVRDIVECELVERVCSASLSEGSKSAVLMSLAKVPGGGECYALSSGDERTRATSISQTESGEDVACVAVHGAYQT